MASSLPSLFKPEPISHRGKYFKYATLIVVVCLALGLPLWFLFRFHSEEATVRAFMENVIGGHYHRAYAMWQAGQSYQYSDFLQDWGPSGYYGPVRSFRIVAAHEPPGASGVIIVVDVSPYSPFPSESNFEKARKTKEARLWVQFNNHSISDAPSLF